MTAAFAPRSWQIEAASVFARLADRDPSCRALVAAATGAGKSELMFMLAREVGGRVLLVAHTDVLVAQLAAGAAKRFPGKRVGLVKASKNEVNADVVVASVQTLANPERLASLVASQVQDVDTATGPFTLIVIDEAHHACGESTYERVLAAFPRIPALGLSATPERLDKKDLAKVWKDGVVYRYTIAQGVKDGVLVPITDGHGNLWKALHIEVPWDDPAAVALAAKAAAGDDTDLEKKHLGAHVWPVVAQTIADVAIGMGRRLACFTPDVESAREVARLACALGVRAAAVDGTLKREEQRRILKEHREGRLDALVSCLLLTEGWDDRAIEAIVWARLTQSRSLFLQSVGRGLRVSPETGKKDCVLADLTASLSRHGLTPTESFFLEPPPEQGEGDPTEGGEGGLEADRASRWRTLLLSLKGRKTIECAKATNALWLTVYEEKCYVLNGSSLGVSFTVERTRDPQTRKELRGWSVWLEPAGKGERALLLNEHLTFDEARHLAEEEARAGEGFAARDAAWRERPPTERLLRACEAWRIEVPAGATAGDLNEALTVAVAKARRRNRWERGYDVGGLLAFA